jgi:hypothetical protein
MPRFKPLDFSPRVLAVELTRQLLPGTFEYALYRLLDHEIDVSAIEARFSNDEGGALAYDLPRPPEPSSRSAFHCGCPRLRLHPRCRRSR